MEVNNPLFVDKFYLRSHAIHETMIIPGNVCRCRSFAARSPSRSRFVRIHPGTFGRKLFRTLVMTNYDEVDQP